MSFQGVDLSIPLMIECWQQQFASGFPKVQEQPAYVQPAENFDFPELPNRVSLAVELAPPNVPRFWFLSQPEEDELIQLQRNWFACNWRKVSRDAQYGRWPSIRAAFASRYGQFLSFCEDHKLGEIEIEQSEVTYVNHIEPGSAWESLGQMDRVLRVIGSQDLELFNHDPEQSVMRISYRMQHPSIRGGRLHVSIEPGLRVHDMRPLIALTLTARTIPISEGIDGLLSSMDAGREWIVECFAAITTPAAHQQWERYE